MASKKTRVLILGGGFGGIKTALELADNKNFDITLLSNQSDFRYYPTLYHAATGGRMAASSIPLAEIFKDKNIKLEKGTAKSLINTII
jgi:NADH dehydrogenase